jgi:periplasmic protein TonB
MNRLELPLLPITFVLSVVVHGAAFIVGGTVLRGCGTSMDFTPPELIPSQPGVASIKLVASDAARPRPTDEPSDLLADLPILDDAVNPPPLVDPKLVKPKQPPMERPREHEPSPKLISQTKIVTPTTVPELTADLIPLLTTPLETAKTTAPQQPVMERPRVQVDPKAPANVRIVTPAAVPDLPAELTPLMPPKEMVKPHDPLKPIAMNRSKTEKAELPKLETITKVADRVAKAAPASEEIQGTVDDLPQKLPVNPPPPYPADAVAARQEGTVTLRVTISAEGRVTASSIYASSGVPSLDDSALSTVRRWVFAPARRGGRAVPFEVLVPIEFSIRRSL